MDEYPYTSLSKGCIDRSGRGVQKGLPPLGKGGLPSLPNLLCEGRSHERTDDRCIRERLVRCPSPKDNLGTLARGMEESVHELEGTKSSTSIPNVLSGRFGRLSSNSTVRQHNSPFLSEEGGFPSFIGTGGFNRRDLLCLRGVRHLDPSHSSEGQNQCSSRPRVQEWPNINRMVPGRQFVPMVLSKVGSSSSGPLRHEVQQQDPDIHIAMSRSRVSRLGFSGEMQQLEPVEIYIPISSLSNSRDSGWLTRLLQRGRIFDSPFLADSSLVHSLVEEMSHQVPITKEHVSVPEIFRSGVLPQQPFSFKSSRLEVVKEAVMAECLTEISAQVLCRCQTFKC